VTYVVLFALAVVLLGGPLRRVRRALSRKPTAAGAAEPGLPDAAVEAHPMRRRRRLVDELGPWREDALPPLPSHVQAALHAEIRALTGSHAP
jgi:hypothetical protein